MPQTFYNYIKPTLSLCNIFGIVYNVGHTGYLQTAKGILLIIPFFITYSSLLLCSAFLGNAFKGSHYGLSNIMSISHVVGLTFGMFCIYSKAIHYFIKRHEINDIILQVRNEMQFYMYL